MIKVLIVDDEPKIRRGIFESIDWQKLGMEVLPFAENGSAIIALECANEFKPQICLVDINMPVINGFEFIEKIHNICPDAICIVITGYDEFEYAQKAVSMGVFEYVLKPVNEKHLYEVIVRAKKQIQLILILKN